MAKYRTAIEQYFAQRKKVLVLIWSETHRASAEAYVKEGLYRFPDGDAVVEVVGNIGSTDRIVIHYHRAT